MTNTPPLNLLAALLAAQREAEPVAKSDRAGKAEDKMSFRYASGVDVVEAGRRLLHAQGLALVLTSTTSTTLDGPRGVVELGGFVFHAESGEVLDVLLTLPYYATKGRPDDNAALGSITKGEARLVRLLLALTTAEEGEHDHAFRQDDGPGDAPAAKVPPRPLPKPVPAAREVPAAVDEERTAAPTKAAAKAEERPAAAAASSAPFRTPADFAAEGLAVDDREASTAEDVERFKAVAKRLRLDPDTAASWASRLPVGAKIKTDPDAAWHGYGDAKASGVLGDLSAILEADADDLKSKRIHPKDGWAEAVKAWSVALIPY